MPNNIDFSKKVKNIKEIEVNPKGWINPLTIEYGTSEKVYPIESYCWRIKGTAHTFLIPIVRMDFISGGDYVKHFEHVLEIFREDYTSWEEQRIEAPWANEYRRQYKSFIVI